MLNPRSIGLGLSSWLALANASWTLVTVDSGPSARSLHAAAGVNHDRFWVHAGSGESLLEDLWVYHFTADVWIQFPLFSTAPSARKEHVAAWDPDEEALWIHGGNNGSSSLEDLWKLSSNSWVLVDNMAPARSNHVAVWDTWSSALWIHGGYDGALKSDIWKFDSRSSIWSRIQDTNPPSARAHHVAAFDEIARVIWIHAGYDGSLCQDLWKFDMNTYHWTWVSSDGPSARAYHAAGWDPMNLALWIHGGFDGVALQDLWRFSTLGNTWELIADGGPSPRYNHVAAWDVASLSFVIHGGYGGGLLQDLWRFQASTMTVSSSSTHTSTSSTSTSSTSTSSTTSADFNASIDGLFPLTPATPDLTTCFVAIGLGIPAILLLMLYLFCKFSRTRGVAPLPPPLPPPIPPASLNLRTNTQFLDAPPPPLPPCHSREPMYLPDITLSVAPLSHKADDESCPSQICIEVAPEAELPIDAVDVHVALAPVGSCEEPVDSLRPRCPHRTQTVPRLQEAQNGTARDAPDSSERRQGMRVEQRRVEAEGTVWTEEQSRFSQSPVCLQHVTGDTVTEQWASPNERTLKWSRLIARCYEDKPRKAPEVHRDPQMHRASDAPVNRVSDKINPPQIDRRRKPRFPGRTESAPQLSQPAGNTNATHFGRVPIAADLLPTPPTPQPQSSRLAEPPPRHEREHYPGPAPFLSLGPRGTCHANTFSTREEAAPAPVDGHVVVASKATCLQDSGTCSAENTHSQPVAVPPAITPHPVQPHVAVHSQATAPHQPTVLPDRKVNTDPAWPLAVPAATTPHPVQNNVAVHAQAAIPNQPNPETDQKVNIDQAGPSAVPPATAPHPVQSHVAAYSQANAPSQPTPEPDRKVNTDPAWPLAVPAATAPHQVQSHVAAYSQATVPSQPLPEPDQKVNTDPAWPLAVPAASAPHPVQSHVAAYSQATVPSQPPLEPDQKVNTDPAWPSAVPAATTPQFSAVACGEASVPKRSFSEPNVKAYVDPPQPCVAAQAYSDITAIPAATKPDPTEGHVVLPSNNSKQPALEATPEVTADPPETHSHTKTAPGAVKPPSFQVAVPDPAKATQEPAKPPVKEAAYPAAPLCLELPRPKFLQRSRSAPTPRPRLATPARVKSTKGQMTSTMGGPWVTVPKGRWEWVVANRNTPGPGSYNLEHPGILGRIPGREPGYPQLKRNPEVRT